MTDPAAAFDAAFRIEAPHLRCRPERPDDAPFLVRQFMACSALAGLLPEAMLAQQAEMQIAAHNGHHAQAMHRIATLDGEPIGRLMIDWNDDESYCVDVAVLPAYRKTRAGRAMLRAWIAVCDLTRRRARLDVQTNNPALGVYERLGFVIAPDARAATPVVEMVRAPITSGT